MELPAQATKTPTKVVSTIAQGSHFCQKMNRSSFIKAQVFSQLQKQRFDIEFPLQSNGLARLSKANLLESPLFQEEDPY